MFSFLSIKDAVYVGIIVVMIGAAWYLLNDWHYKPLKQNKVKIESLQFQLTQTGNALNTCEANLSKQLLQGYIDGIGENNENNGVDLNNLHT